MFRLLIVVGGTLCTVAAMGKGSMMFYRAVKAGNAFGSGARTLGIHY